MRNIVVCIKYCLDTSLPLQILEDENRVTQAEEDEPIFVINPADLCALEESLRIKSFFNFRVIVITLGSESVIPALKYCLARGADHAILLSVNKTAPTNPSHTAAVLADGIQGLLPWLVFCGNKSIDNGSGIVGPMLAEYLNFPQVTNITKIVSFANDEIIAQRKLEKGSRQVISSPLPALISVSEFLNHPRYVALYKQQYIPDDRIEKRLIKSNFLENTWVERVSLPKPRPRKMASPDNSLTASDRLKFMMTGGMKNKETNTFEGTPEEAAEKIYSYIQKNGIQ